LISIIIYARDRENDLRDTFLSVRKACIQAEVDNYEVVLVNDRSVDSTFQQMKALASEFKNIEVCQTVNAFGINEAIMSGFAKSQGQIIFPIPGHNMFDVKAIETILRNSRENRIVVGYRSNLFTSRPPLKYFASRLLGAAYSTLVFNDLKDIHGLNSYPAGLIFLAQSYKLGHGFHMIPLTIAKTLNYEIFQVGIEVSLSHKRRKAKKFNDNWPSIKSVLAVVEQLYVSWRIKKISSPNES
jgi:glycosyltransferase involved in cell wall biosynthesis